jgi:hypothetical protein
VNRSGDAAPNGCTANHCTLREAVLAANNSSEGRDTVILPKRRGRYELEIPNPDPAGEDGALAGDIDVTNDPLTIKHRGRGLATVDGNGLDRIFHAFTPLTLKRIRLTGGDSTGNSGQDGGGAVLVDALLTAVDSKLTRNRGDHGGAIHVQDDGRLRVVRSLVSRNRDTDAGAGIFLTGATGLISRSQIVRNRMVNDSEGGGISSSQSRLVISKSTIAKNVSQREAGGIAALATQLRIKGSTISGNSAISTTPSPGPGGGIYLFDGNARIINSTVAGNTASADGGGISVNGAGELTLNAVTVARNLANSDETPISEGGGGLSHDTAGTVTVSNTILALNTLGPGPRNDCTGNPVSSGGGNLLSTLGPSDICLGFAGPGDVVRGNPRIGKLADNGGPTATVALKRGSPAIGRARASAPGKDQRGQRRDRDPDSGAFER